MAATGLAITMVPAFVMHARRGEVKASIGPNLAVAVLVAWGRIGPYAF